MITDLQFGVFFLAHPVAGYSLWQFLHACDELDVMICGSSQVKSWLDLKPFHFLEKGEIQRTWKNSLHGLQEDIENGNMGNEALLQKLYTIFNAVEKLDGVFKSLDDSFLSNLEGKHLARRMMKTIRSAYDWRRQMIANLTLVEDDTRTAFGTDTFYGDSEDLTSSKELKPKRISPSRSRPKSKGKKKKRASKRKNDAEPLRWQAPSPRSSTWITSSGLASALFVAMAAYAIYIIGVSKVSLENLTVTRKLD